MQACPDEDTLLRAATSSVDATLEAHLDACSSCRQVLAAIVSEGREPAARRIDRYEIERTLGFGGMGVVYAARDPKLHRMVAVKVLRGTNLERMQREARVMAQLAHPHVVNVFDTGESEGRVFVAMELLHGGTLRSWLATPRSQADVLRVFRQAGEGLAAAHDAGIVHRDFKPENVLLGGDGRACVSDFGLAADATTTDSGRVGTLAYMAPEQLAGLAVDARADQFAFCVSLYEALASQRPSRPPKPIDVACWPALERGLSEDPSRRFESMRALLTALDRKKSRAPWLLLPLLVALVVALASFDTGTPQKAPVGNPTPAVKPLVTRELITTQQDWIVEPTREVPMPSPGARITLSPEDVRSFRVEDLTVARIANPEVVDVDGSSGEVILSGRSLGTTTLTLEFGKRVQRWTIEVRTPVADAAQQVRLAVDATKEFTIAGITRVTLGDATVVDLEGPVHETLRFTGKRAGSTNALVWTEDARRFEFRFEVGADQSLVLVAGIQQVLEVDDVMTATVTPASACDAQVLSAKELLLTPQRSGDAVLTLQHRDGTEEKRALRITGK